MSARKFVLTVAVLVGSAVLLMAQGQTPVVKHVPIKPTNAASGQEMLHRELHSLTAYLVEEKVAVNAVVVHVPTPPAIAQQGFAGTGDPAGQARQGANEGKQQQQYAGDSPSTKPGEGTAYGSLRDPEDDGGLQTAMFASGGNWLSVRA